MQDQDSKTPDLNIDFSHRLAITDYLTDSVNLIADRAIGVLSILAMQFHESKNVPVFQSDSITASAMDSVLCDLEDIKNLVSAHYERSRIQKQNESTQATKMIDERMVYSFLDAFQINVFSYFDKPKHLLHGEHNHVSDTLFLMWQNHKRCGAMDTLSDYDNVTAE